jgi:hypothetical protein
MGYWDGDLSPSPVEKETDWRLHEISEGTCDLKKAIAIIVLALLIVVGGYLSDDRVLTALSGGTGVLLGFGGFLWAADSAKRIWHARRS